MGGTPAPTSQPPPQVFVPRGSKAGEASRKRAEALAAKKAAKTKEEKAKAAAEFKLVEQDRVNAENKKRRAEANVAGSSPAGEQPATSRLSTETVSAIA
jgi:hypothetical protein